MDENAVRRRGIRKILVGVGVLALVIVITVVIAPMYFR
jgi:hypothetical protein